MIRTDWLCLSLTKTRGWEARDPRRDRIATYPALVEWAVGEEVIDRVEAAGLERRSGQEPAEAAGALERIHAFRASTHALLSSLGGGGEPDPAAMRTLNRWLPPAFQGLELVAAEGGGFDRRWSDDEEDLDRILWACVRSLADLLLAPELKRLKFCDAHDCGWLFIDASRNRSRRWCDMADCGNRAKVARYRRRRRRPGAGGH